MMEMEKKNTVGESSSSNNNNTSPEKSTPILRSPIGRIIIVASIASGVQFGWALQLSLLTPYVQQLGVPHLWAAFIWLCGPISGLLVQPIVGYYSDRCSSRFGRRRPFIVGGAALVVVSIFLIGFAADIGSAAGDVATRVPKPRAVAIFVVGFWILDVANNMLQGPCRALLADISGDDHRRTRVANAFFSFFMGVGNVLGYAAGSYKKMHRLLPFTQTVACDVYCANLKSCFIIGAVFLLCVTFFAMSLVHEKGGGREGGGETGEVRVGTAWAGEMAEALKMLSKPMWILMGVTALNWVAWFPFIQYDTDWMGREVYGGRATGDHSQVKLYDLGVRTGSLGLLLTALVSGITSLAVEPASRLVGVKSLWASVNFLLALSLAMTLWITNSAQSARNSGALLPPPRVTVASLLLFALTGVPQAVTYSIPFALASIFSNQSGAGQGLSLGVLNLAITTPQMLVAVVSGPLDGLFGGGNLPAFMMGAGAAVASGVMALIVLPSSSEHPKLRDTHGQIETH